MLIDKRKWKKKEGIDLDEIGFSDCGESSWEFIDGEDYGDGGCERWRDPKTDKVYEILWDRVRHTNDAVEVE
jgi:hypothetical protein|tara:strand:+ start:58 stop:273 length:216 start_codon:yes stop_codon:yes gene_type:complete